MEAHGKMLRKSKIDIGSSAHDVLRLLFEHGPQRQGEIAQRLAITKAACNLHFRKLMDENLIVPENEPQLNGRGRPSQLWKIRGDGNYFMGIFFHEMELSMTIMDFYGHIRQSATVFFDEAPDNETFLEKLFALVTGGCDWIRKNKGDLLQSFLCVGGAIAPDGTLLHLPDAPALSAINPEQSLIENLGIPCYCDTLHYAYVQNESSHLPPSATALLLDWGNGLGGAVVCNRQILSWSKLPAQRNRGLWNLGHIPVVKDGNPCYCGRNGCLETYVGGMALAQRHSALRVPDDRKFFQLALAKDREACMLLEEAAQRIGSSLYWLLELFGVDTIIVLGSFAGLFERFAAAFRRGLEEMRTPEDAAVISLQASRDPRLGLGLGAALMARQFFFYPDEPLNSRGVYRPLEPAIPDSLLTK